MIDWSQPLFCDCRPMVMDHNGDQFKGMIFADDPQRKRWYFNLDGSPFAKNPHGPVSNFQVDVPEDEYHLAWRAEQDAKAEALEAIPGYGAFS
jgi:hypothetical protein